jgi:hypothetical protein
MERAVKGFNLPEGIGLDFVLLINRSVFLSWYWLSAQDPQARRKVAVVNTTMCAVKVPAERR